MASYRGGFNASAPDGGGGYTRGSYRGGGGNCGGQGDDNAAGNSGSYRGGAPRGGYGQQDNSSSAGEGYRGGRGGYFQRDENQSGSSGYRGGFSRGGGIEGYSRGGGSEGYSRGGGTEGYSRGGGAEGYGQSSRGGYRGASESQNYRGSGEGYRGSNRGVSFNRGGGSQADIGEQSGGYRGGWRGGYSSQGFQDNRDLTAPRVTSSYQPTEDEKARLTEWDATPVTKPSPFAAFKKSNDASMPPKQPEQTVQPAIVEQEPIVKSKVDELVVEESSAMHNRIDVDDLASGTSLSDKLKKYINAGVEFCENDEEPPVVAAVSVTFDKELSKPLDVIADVTKEPIPEDPVKSVRALEAVEAVSSNVGLVRALTLDDLKKLAEISGTFKDAFSKLHEVVVSLLE